MMRLWPRRTQSKAPLQSEPTTRISAQLGSCGGSTRAGRATYPLQWSCDSKKQRPPMGHACSSGAGQEGCRATSEV